MARALHYTDRDAARWEATVAAGTRRLAFLGVIGMLAVGILTSLDVLLFRALFNSPIPGSNEVLQTVLAVSISAVIASGLAERANLQVDALASFFGARATAWLQVVGDLLLIVVFVLVAWRSGVQAAHAWRLSSQTVILQLPLSPFLWGISAMLALCVPVQLVMFLSSLANVLTADRDAGTEGRVNVLWPIGSLVVAALAVLAFYLLIEAAGPTLSSSPAGLALGIFVLLWILVLAQIPVGVALILCGVVGTALAFGWNRALLVVGSETLGLFTNAELALIPLFLMMGAFANISGMSADIYRLAHAAFGSQKGGIALATVAGCAGFGALTGSSIATAATIGSVALPEMRQRGYAASLATGCVAAGATLGQLVPPSTIIVLYAILVEESIGQLYIAILLPALLSIILYMITIAIIVRLKPEIAPGRDRFHLMELLLALRQAIGVVILFAAVIGGIYAGIFTPTEAAAIGAVFTFAVSVLRGKLNRRTIWLVAAETTRSVAMLYVLIIGALLMSFFMSVTGLPSAVIQTLAASDLTPLMIIGILIVIFLVLGTVMDATAVMIMTAGIVAPLVVSLGYNPIWWGVMMVVLVEIGVVTPPFGVNLFVLKSFQKDVSLTTIYRGVMPFVAVDLIKVAILLVFPVIALWLPTTSRALG